MHDPGNELTWLNNTLRDIERRNEIAIIIGHVPPGNSNNLD